MTILVYIAAILLLQVRSQQVNSLVDSTLNLANLIHTESNDFLPSDFSCMSGCLSDFFGNLCYGSTSSSSCGQAANKCSLLLGFDATQNKNLDNCVLQYHNPSCSYGHCWGIITNTPGMRCSVDGHIFTCAGGTHCSLANSESSLEICTGNINFNSFGTFTTSATQHPCPSSNQKNATTADIQLDPVYPGTMLHI